MFQQNGYATEEQYNEKVKECRKDNKTLIVIFSMDFCAPCNQLENLVKPRTDIEYVKIKLGSKVCQKFQEFYSGKGVPQIRMAPDWLVVRYKDDKIVYAQRYLGAPFPRQLDQFIFEAKSQTRINYNHGR